MFTTSRHLILFVISTFILLGALVIVLQYNQQADWQTYQHLYFERTGQSVDIRIRKIVPQTSDQPELCPTCHLGLAEISPSHPVDVFGCVSCHGGNGLSLETELAHQGLRGGKNPSDFPVVEESCGSGCHNATGDPEKDHVDSVLRSVQGTYAGGIANVRFSFGLQPDDNPIYGVYGITDDKPTSRTGIGALDALPRTSDHPIEQNFIDNCLDGGCHLSEPARSEPYFYRSTGCAACHVLYATDGLYWGDDPTIPHDEPGHMRVHQLTTAIPFNQCNHCHNRGNYSLRQMEFLLREDLPPARPHLSEQMPEEGRRLIEYYQPIGRFTLCEWELDCIECHTTQEIMGDGDIYPNQAAMQYTQCQTCHGTIEKLPDVVTVTAEHETALRIAQVNPNYDLQIGDQVIVTERGELMGNIKKVDDQLILTSKVSGQTYPVNPVLGSGCRQNVNEQESRYCHECHAYEQ